MKHLCICLMAILLALPNVASAAGARPAADPIERPWPKNLDLPTLTDTGDICTGNGTVDVDAVLVLEFKKDGSVDEYVCDGGQNSETPPQDNITQPADRPADAHTQARHSVIVIRKWTDGKVDPCYEYEMDGELRTTCW